MEKDVKEFTEKMNGRLSEIEKGQKDVSELLNGKADVETLEKAQDTLTELSEKMKVDGKSMPDYVKALQSQNDKLETRVKEMAEQRQGQKSQGDLIGDSLRQILKESGKDGLINKGRTQDGLEIKANTITFSNSFTETYYNAIPQDQRLPGIQSAPLPMPTVFNLMNPGVTSRRYVPYVEQSGFTSGASMVDDETAGGQADIEFEDKQAQVKDISVKLYASRDSIDDVDYLQSEIQRMMNHDIVQKRENQLLTGTGAGNNLHGLVYSSDPIAQLFSRPTGVDQVNQPSIATVLYAAVTQVMLGQNTNFKTGYMPNGIVVHPTVLTNLMNETAEDGHYRRHPMLSADGTRLAGIPIIPSKFIDSDTYIVGDFAQARPFVRRNMSMRILDQNDTYGESDVLTFVLKYRMAFFVPSPHDYAFVYGSIASGLTDMEKVTA